MTAANALPPIPPPVDAAGQLRLSIPPSSTANKQPLPPGMAGTADGQPPRRRLKIDDDPFGAVGDYAAGFLVKSALEDFATKVAMSEGLKDAIVAANAPPAAAAVAEGGPATPPVEPAAAPAPTTP